jgi:hypothetical protein
MSYPPGTPDPDAPRDPWTPTPGQPGHPGQPAYGGVLRPTNGKAQAALWSALGLLLTSCCLLGVLGFIPVILGVQARREIREGGGRQGGDAMALSGIIIGALAMVVSLLAIALVALILARDGSSFDTYNAIRV